MKCPKCNTENKDDAYFCHNCPHQFKQKTNGWAVFFAVLFVVAGILAVYFYSEFESQGYRISILKDEINNIRDDYNQEVRKNISLTNLNNSQKSEIEKMKPQRYRVKYDNQNIYINCGKWRPLDCSYKKGTFVDIYWQNDGFGITYWGGWIPMDRLEK